MAKSYYIPPKDVAPSEGAAMKAAPNSMKGASPQMYLTPGGTLSSSAQTGWIQNTPYNPVAPATDPHAGHHIAPGFAERHPGAHGTPTDPGATPAPTDNIVGNMGSYPKLGAPTLPALPQGTLTLPQMPGGSPQLPSMPNMPPLGVSPFTPAQAAQANAAPNSAVAAGAPAGAPPSAPTTGWDATVKPAAPSSIGGAVGQMIQNGQFDKQALMQAVQARIDAMRAQHADPTWKKEQLGKAADMMKTKPVEPVQSAGTPFPVQLPLGMLNS